MSASVSPFGLVRSLAIGTASAALATARSIPLKKAGTWRQDAPCMGDQEEICRWQAPAEFGH
jgi:hypothetical protein